MLQSILAVTTCASDLAAVESAYAQHLHYRTVERGAVSPALARLWRAPRMAGRDCLLMQPMSREPVFLRFVQSESVAGYAPMKSFGWNATEILVEDPDRLAVKLAASPFKIIGEPRGLSSNEQIRAMQVVGPANELLYLTRIPADESTFNLGSAKTEIDRVFIVVAGGRDLQAMREFYATTLRMPVSEPAGIRVSVLSNAYSMNPEHLHKLSIAKLPPGFLIELDEYPPGAIERPVREGELPPGMSTVSFNVESLRGFEADSIVVNDAPYDGRRVALAVGAAGERIELVE